MSVFTQEDLTNIPGALQVFRAGAENSLTGINIYREDIGKEIDRLSSNKSPGVDLVYPRVLKEGRDVVSGVLMEIFNKSVRTGEVPSLWRHVNAILLFKKGDRNEKSDYRPVSLTSVIP